MFGYNANVLGAEQDVLVDEFLLGVALNVAVLYNTVICIENPGIGFSQDCPNLVIGLDIVGAFTFFFWIVWSRAVSILG